MISASESETASIAPSATFFMSRPRAHTSEIASSSVNTPLKHAAVYSPKLCPISFAGLIPHDDPHLCEGIFQREQDRLCVPGELDLRRRLRGFFRRGIKQLAKIKTQMRPRLLRASVSSHCLNTGSF